MVEQFIKDDLMTFVLNSTAQRLNASDISGFVEADDVLMDDEQLIDYFGKLYAKQPENFRFQPGDKMLIKELVSYVSELVDANGINSGLIKFKTKRLTKTKKKLETKSQSKTFAKTISENNHTASIIGQNQLRRTKIRFDSACYQLHVLTSSKSCVQSRFGKRY